MKEIDPANNGAVSDIDEENIASVYERLTSDRQDFLDRARENSALTIPSLLPPEGHSPGQDLPKPYQSIGSHGVNTLTAKLVTTVLPPNMPNFRLSYSDQVVEDLADDPEARSGIEKKLNEIERTAQEEIEGLGVRAAITEAFKHLIVAGNVLLYVPPKGNIKIYKLDRYVVQRDYEGNLLRVIIKETLAKEALPEYVRKLVCPKNELPSDGNSSTDTNEFDIYTVFYRDGDRVRTYQWIKGIKLKKSMGSWPLKKSPIMPLRWSYIHDEDYGRAYVSEYFGDLSGVEALSKAVREAAAASAKMVTMVNPTGLTRAIDIARSENLGVISGRADDVSMLQFDKQADMAVTQSVLQDLIARLQHAFMMNRSVQRNAERVTAEEIKAVIGEIDDILGGFYSLIAQELQHPLVSRLLDRMEREKKIPALSKLKGPDGKPIAAPKIITGVEALGRGQDYNKYMTLARDVLVPFKEEAAKEVNIGDFIKRAAVSLSIDTDGLIKSEEDKQRDLEKAQGLQQQQLMQEMLKDGVKGAAGPIAKEAAGGIAAQVAPQQEGTG